MQTHAQPGDNSQAAFLGFIEEYADVDAAVAQAVGMRKDLRARIRGAGINLAAFDRARAEAEKSGEKREAEDREYRRLMLWLGKPVGYQAGLFSDGETDEVLPDEVSSVTDHQRMQVEGAGGAAAATGKPRDSNPWTPGTELWALWDGGWERTATAATTNGSAPPDDAPPPRRRGRPPGSRNKPKTGGLAA